MQIQDGKSYITPHQCKGIKPSASNKKANVVRREPEPTLDVTARPQCHGNHSLSAASNFATFWPLIPYVGHPIRETRARRRTSRRTYTKILLSRL
ncbi:secreted protein [Moniliophthora roreri]|nr:secreted protein [Moniliophthora roreri]